MSLPQAPVWKSMTTATLCARRMDHHLLPPFFPSFVPLSSAPFLLRLLPSSLPSCLSPSLFSLPLPLPLPLPFSPPHSDSLCAIHPHPQISDPRLTPFRSGVIIKEGPLVLQDVSSGSLSCAKLQEHYGYTISILGRPWVHPTPPAVETALP